MSVSTASEGWIEARKQVTGRACGECSACCKLLAVPEINKPPHQWCKHCRPGRGGCLIYDRRPTICRVFACAWLIDENVPDHWFPKRARMVMRYELEDGQVCL